MSENRPLVSIIIGTYRREDTLRASVQSAVNQTYKNVEILIADDNADESWNARVERIADEFGVIHVKNEKNLGSAENRNHAVAVSKGGYVAFLDDDDVYLEGKIERQLACIMRENADVCIEDLRLVNENGEYVESRKRTYLTDFSKNALMRAHLMHHMSGTDSLMFKRAYFDKIGGFPPINLGDEFYLMARAIEGGGKIVYHPETGAEAVVHSETGGLSSGQNKLKCERDLHAYKKAHREYLSRADWRYVVMRHHAVNAFAYLRMKNPLRFFVSAALSFASSPAKCLSFLKEKLTGRSEG